MENGENSYIPQINIEKKTNTFELNLPVEVKQELGPENLENLTNFSSALKEELKEKGVEGHLFLIGGTILPEKKGMFHKDVDLLFYSKELSLKNIFIKEDDKDFAKFSGFFKDVGDKLGWTEKVEKPYFYSYQYSYDGSVELKPKNGVPIEIITIREDNLNNSFEEYIENQDRPGVVLF